MYAYMSEQLALAPVSTAPPAFAALDLGTNNCRLLVGAPVAGGFRVLDSYSRLVRLGEGLDESGSLSPYAMDRALDALQGCADRLARRPVRAVRAVATEACRRALNGADFLERVQRETGLTFDVISSREEAELALESVTPLLAPLAASGTTRALLFDIGGGSTELAWIRLADRPHLPPELIGYVSLPVGVVGLAERWERHGFDVVADEVERQLRPFEAIHRIGAEIARGRVALVGTSGTVTTLAGVALNLPRYRRPLVDGVVLSRDDAATALARLRALGPDALAAHPCVGADRASFVLPGCAIYSAIARLWPASQVVVADRGLREGMLLRMMRAERTRR